MSPASDEEKIKAIIEALFDSFENTDEEKFLSVTHPEVRAVNIGNSNEVLVSTREEIVKFRIRGLRNAKQQNPEFYARNEIKTVNHITVHEVIASAEVEYRMVMPEAVGLHCSYIQLVKMEEDWRVVNILDRGIEESQ